MTDDMVHPHLEAVTPHSSKDLIYCPNRARHSCVLSEWNCRRRVSVPTTKGAPSRGSDTFRLRSVPGDRQGVGHSKHANSHTRTLVNIACTSTHTGFMQSCN